MHYGQTPETDELFKKAPALAKFQYKPLNEGREGYIGSIGHGGSII